MTKTIAIHRQEQVRSATESCVHFGFCTAVCPTYVLDGEELDSPRGRIALARDMLSSNAPPSATAIRHLDRCLSCLSCETTCAAGVSYREIIDGARQYIEQSRVRPLRQRLLRWLVARVLTTPALLRPALKISGACQGLSRLLPASLGTMVQLAEAPALKAFAPRSIPPAPTALPPTRRLALLTGCVQSVLGAEINASAARLLARHGIAVEPMPDVQCCGALELHMGKRDDAVQHMKRTVRLWSDALKTGRIDAVVNTTSGCGSVIKHYDAMLSDHPELSSDVRRVIDATVDITEIAATLPLSTTGATLGLAVSYHDACSLKHGLRLERPPRRVLNSLGIETLDIAESHLCCGSAGTYNILEPEMSARLGQRKAAHAQANQPDVIAAGNIGCLVQISRYTAVPVAHTVQLLDWATGGPCPRGLENFQPRTPAVPDSQALAPEPAAATANSGDFLW